MDEIAGIPFVKLVVDKQGRRTPDEPPALPAGVTDVILISHGWKNDELRAETLYEMLLGNVIAAAGAQWNAQRRKFAVLGVFWPAFRYRPDLTLLQNVQAAEDGQGGGVIVGDEDVPIEDLRSYAEGIAEDFGTAQADFVKLAEKGVKGGQSADAFVENLRAELLESDDATQRDDHAALFEMPGRELIAALKEGGPMPARAFGDEARPPEEDLGGAAAFEGVKATLTAWRTGARAAVASILNQATYYEMKARAGTVGQALATQVEPALPGDVRLHLIGHSFGARLVTAFCAALTDTRPQSMTLLQGAFSHNGFGSGEAKHGIEGAFRKIVDDKRVIGPLLVTHTQKDSAVGFFYALASAVSGDVSRSWGLDAVIGGPNDKHGGLGANGARSLLTGEWVGLVATGGTPPALTPGIINNVQSDAIIFEHNEVTTADVGRLVWQAIR